MDDADALHDGAGDPEIGPAVVRRPLGGVDDLVGAERLGQAPPGGREVRREHRPMAAALERGDHRQPDRAAPDDEAGLARVEVGQTHGVLAHGERLGQRRQVGVQRVGHREQQQLLEHHVLGERARVGVGIADLLHAGRAQDDGHRADTGSDGQGAGCVGPVLHDFRAELVTEDTVRGRVQGGHTDGVHEPGEVGEIGQRVQVGSADAGGERAHHHMARRRHGLGHVAHHQPSTPGHRGTHGRATPTDGAPARIRRYVCPVSFTHDAAARPFAGSVALVTGAARPRGIGRATAVALASGGADVACLDIARPYDDAPFHGTGSGDDLEGLAAELAGLGVRATTVQADVSDEAAVEAAVARATEELGTITLVANVAGGSGPGFGLGPLLNVPAEEFRRVLDVNVVGTWLVSKACATRMVDAGVGGRICNVSSQAGKRAFPFLGAYCAAKAGIILLTQTMATELGASGHRRQRSVPRHGGHRPHQPGCACSRP